MTFEDRRALSLSLGQLKRKCQNIQQHLVSFFSSDTITVMGYSTHGALVLSVPAPSSVTCQHSEFDRILQRRWKEAADAGVCFYRLNRLQNKIIPGQYRFVAQYNPEKSKPGWRRPSQNLQKVNQPFDPLKFNFNQIHRREVIMGPDELLLDSDDEIDTFLIINMSPLEFGSCLLVPNVSQNIPQRMTLNGLELLLRTVLRSADPRFKAGFSSPGGCASINHQHYHLYYLQEQLYLETAPIEHIAGPCFTLKDYPAKGFAFQLDTDPTELARHVFTLADYMRQNEIAHNMFVTRGRRFEGLSPAASDDDDVHCEIIYDTLRVFLWAREPVFGAKKDYGGMNPALCELAGHLLMTDHEEYETTTEKVVSNIFENLTSSLFQRLLPKIPQLFNDSCQDSS